MRKFLIKLFIVTVITLIADRVLALIVGHFYKTTTTADEYKLNQVTYKLKAPVIFMGSSRCHHHYVPSIISDTLKTDVYNAGLWGMRNIYFQYSLLSNIVENYTPKTIILEIHPIDYLHTPFSDIETMGVLTPFIGYSSGCDEVLKKAKLYNKTSLSHLYRYNSLFPNIIAGNIAQRSNPADKGLKPLIGQLDIKSGDIKPEKFPYPVDEEKLRYLQLFVNVCKQKKIQLIFIFSPMYAVEKRSSLFIIPNKIALKNNIPFINHYYLEGITGHAEYFFDYGHLNSEGAKKYSSIVASELKQYFKKKSTSVATFH
ncbi:MAG: hypothetical protein JWN56_727 [Sphingobacteriales bacterium]|nr:hypothetical protein [Sphingobacteriales bacterium]